MKNLIESGKIREVLQSSVGVVWETRCAVIHSPWYRTAKPVDVPAASVVSSMKRYRDLLRRPSLGRYSTSYESYRAAASMLLPFLIKSLIKKKKKEQKEKAREKDWISRVRLISEFKTQAVRYWSAGSCTADLNYTWHVSISIYLKQLFAEFQTAVPQLWRSAQFKNYILKKCKQLFFYKQCLCRLVENLMT